MRKNTIPQKLTSTSSWWPLTPKNKVFDLTLGGLVEVATNHFFSEKSFFQILNIIDIVQLTSPKVALDPP